MATKKEEVKSVKAEVKSVTAAAPQQVKEEPSVTVSYNTPVAPKEEPKKVKQENTAYMDNSHNYSDSRTPIRYQKLFNEFVQLSRLSTEGKSYLKLFSDELRSMDRSKSLQVMDVSTSEIDATVVYSTVDRIAAVLFYYESMQPSNASVPTDKIGTVMSAFNSSINKDGGPEYTVISSVTILPEEYAPNYAVKMAQSILNIFTGFNISVGTDTFTANSLKNETIFVTTNMHEVRDYMRQYSPHAVLDRDDIGFLVRTGTKDSTTNKPIYGDVLFGVTGYTKFLNCTGYNQMAKIRPVATITNIVSRAPISGFIPFAITLAGDCFCRANMWLEPYKNFSTDRPNLGNLVDITGNVPVKTQQELQALITTYFDTPLLALEISDGRYNLPGVTSMVYGNLPMYQHLCRFFGRAEIYNLPAEELKAVADEVLRAAASYETLTGVVVDKQGATDSRWIDYLAMCISFDERAAIQNFRIEANDPLFRINEIRLHYPNTRAVYKTKTIVLTNSFLDWLDKNLVDAKVQYMTDYNAAMYNQINANSLNDANIDWNTRMRPLTNPTMGGGHSGYKNYR